MRDDDFDDLGDLDFDDPEPMSGLVKALLLVSLSFAVASVLMLLAPAGG